MELSESLGMLNSAIQYAGAQMGAVKDKKFIREENQKARDFQLELWNLANQYNLPSAQMQRFRDAGLNPNLIYGQGTSTLADYASAPGHSAPNMNEKDLAKYLGVHESLALGLQEKQTESNIALQASQEDVNEAQKEDFQASAKNKDLNSQLLIGQMETLIESAKEDLNNKKRDGLIKDEDYKIRLKQLEQQDEILRKYKAEADTAQEAINTQKALTTNVQEQSRLYDAEAFKALEQGKTEDFARAKMASDMIVNAQLKEKLRAETNLTDEQINSLIINESKTIAETGKINMETVRDQYGTNAATILNNYYRIGFNGIRDFLRGRDNGSLGGKMFKGIFTPTVKEQVNKLMKYNQRYNTLDNTRKRVNKIKKSFFKWH